MTKIGGICLVTIGIWVVIELAVQFGHYNHACYPGEEGCPTLVNMLVILVGGIPIAMPTVLSVTLALGAAALAKEGAIVARMSAVEEMAGMDILCSDKTGTLTLNKLSIDIPSIHLATPGYSNEDVMMYGALSANTVTEEPIDMVLYNSYGKPDELKGFKTIKFVPFNPVDKFTAATIVQESSGRVFRVMKGSPQGWGTVGATDAERAERWHPRDGVLWVQLVRGGSASRTSALLAGQQDAGRDIRGKAALCKDPTRAAE
eukprot:35902-Chlamydomonas_euryale.AAC.1